MPYHAPFSPSSLSASSRSLTSPTTSMQYRKKVRFPKNLKSTKLRRDTICGRGDLEKHTQSNDESSSIIQKRVGFNYTTFGPPGMSSKSFNDGDSTDDYDTPSETDRYKDDVKLRKRCAVVITPTNEILQYERRKRDLMYNKILQEQRRKLELRAIEKQREKERRLLERGENREEQIECTGRAGARETAIEKDRKLKEYRNHNEMYMSSESELETHNNFSFRKQLQFTKELKPLNIQIEITEATSSLLNEIDAHLDEPETCKRVNDDNNGNEKKTTGVSRHSDIKENHSQTTEMRELNLLADIAQHLSPQNLELHDQQITDQIDILPTTALQKEKPTITEQIIIQSFDNLPEKQLDIKHQTTTKLNTKTAGEESQANKQESHRYEHKALETVAAESLEHILEESIITTISTECSLNYHKDNTSKTESTIPLLISSVESLSHLEVKANKNKSLRGQFAETEYQEMVKEKSNDDDNILITENRILDKLNETKEIENSEEMQERMDTAKVVDNLKSNTDSTLTSNLMASSINTTDLSDISLCEREPSTNQSTLMTADISDISLESEISKHLPDIAEPSPIVKDNSENLMETDISKSCKEPNDACAMTDNISDISLPVLPLVMHAVLSPPPPPPEVEPETNFSINLNLLTPTKMELVPISDSITQETPDILNTPMKIAIEPETETPNKNSQDAETDSNVTKFLDLILNKTVTDDESETRDKILKELNAITAEPTSGTPVDNTETSTPKNSFEFSSSQLLAKSEADNLLNDSVVNPTKSPCKEFNTETLPLTENNKFSKDITPCSIPPPPPCVPLNLKTHSKQIFNIKCRVRLKRLNISKHSMTHKKETWMAIPLTKVDNTPAAAAVLNSNNEILNCDNKNEMTAALAPTKKPSVKQNLSSTHIMEDLLETNQIPENCNDADIEDNNAITKTKRDTTPEQTIGDTSILYNSAISNKKTKSKTLKTVTFDLSNLQEEFRDTSSSSSHKQKLKNYMKSQKQHKKPPETTIRTAETLQLLVNTINDSVRTPPPVVSTEFHKKRCPLSNKFNAEDETTRQPALVCMDNKSRSTTAHHINNSSTNTKCKDQLVSSLATASIPTITSDITTARIYTSSPLDQTLPVYDDNVDTVANSELILPSTTSIGSLRRKLKKPKKTITRLEPADDISADDVSNQPPECNGDDDTDAAVDNEENVFVEELLPIPAANVHILEEIVAARTPHIGTGTVIRDDYTNIEATDTVPVYLFNDESRDLATPEPKSRSETNVVDSSSFLNTTSTSTVCNLTNHTNATTTGNLEKSMLSPSEHEVSSTQETFFQTPTKSKQNIDTFAGDNKDKTTPLTAIHSQKQQEEIHLKSNKDKMSSSTCLLQNNQVDTTNHSPEMCTLTLTTSTTSSTTLSSSERTINRKAAATHDEILYNELQQQKLQQQKQQKRKAALSTKAAFFAESTSGSNNIKKRKIAIEEIKTNGSLGETEKITNEDKRERIQPIRGGNAVVVVGSGGSSPSTTTTINEEILSKSKRKKMKSSKKSKNVDKLDLKTTPSTNESHTVIKPANPLIITIPKSRLLRPPPTPSPTPTPLNEQSESNFLVLKKDKEKTPHHQHHHHHQDHQSLKKDKTLINSTSSSANNKNVKKSKRTYSPANMVQKVFVPDDVKQCIDSEVVEPTNNATQQTTPLNINQISSPSSASLSLTISMKKKGSSNSKTTTKSNVLFVKDKYDLIKSKEKNHDSPEKKDKPQMDSTNKNKEKCVELKTKEKHDKSDEKSSAQRTHKSTTAKDKTKEKQKLKTKTFEKDDTSTNLLKLSTLSGSNKTVPNTSNITNPDLSLFSSSSSSSYSSAAIINSINKQPSRKSKKTNNITTKQSSADTNSSSLNSIKSKSSPSSLQSPLTSDPSLSTPPIVMPVPTNHVRKKVKTK